MQVYNTLYIGQGLSWYYLCLGALLLNVVLGSKKIFFNDMTSTFFFFFWDHCGEVFVHSTSLTRHIRRKHQNDFVPDNKKASLSAKCPICNQTFYKTSINKHIRIKHEGQKPYVCEICKMICYIYSFFTFLHVSHLSWLQAVFTLPMSNIKLLEPKMLCLVLIWLASIFWHIRFLFLICFEYAMLKIVHS